MEMVRKHKPPVSVFENVAQVLVLLPDDFDYLPEFTALCDDLASDHMTLKWSLAKTDLVLNVWSRETLVILGFPSCSPLRLITMLNPNLDDLRWLVGKWTNEVRNNVL
jgi:hypothetical protein